MVRPKHQALLLLLALFWFSPCGAGMADTLIETVDSSYQPDPAALTVLQQIDQPVTILLFYGVWCPDSQREIPRFRRILELVENPYIILDGYEVDRKKQDESGKAAEFGIKFVPTFIVTAGFRF